MTYVENEKVRKNGGMKEKHWKMRIVESEYKILRAEERIDRK